MVLLEVQVTVDKYTIFNLLFFFQYMADWQGRIKKISMKGYFGSNTPHGWQLRGTWKVKILSLRTNMQFKERRRKKYLWKILEFPPINKGGLREF